MITFKRLLIAEKELRWMASIDFDNLSRKAPRGGRS